MSFFLFSFQVHEKTILLPLLPLTLLLSTAPHDSPTFKLGVLANNVGVFRCVSVLDATRRLPRLVVCGLSSERTG
jgi:hypothetical protein